MASIRVEPIEPKNPPLKITIELDLKEAAVIIAGLRALQNNGPVGLVVDELDEALTAYKRIKDYSNLLCENIVFETKGNLKKLNLIRVKFPHED